MILFVRMRYGQRLCYSPRANSQLGLGETIMDNDPLYTALLERIEVLEARERQLTVASHAYQVVITTILGNLDTETRRRIISMVDEAHEIAYSQAVNRSDKHLSEIIKCADEIVQRMFNYAQGGPHSDLS